MIQKTRNILIAAPNTGEEEWLAAKEPLMNGWLTRGPRVAAFKEAFAIRHQVKHAVATTSYSPVDFPVTRDCDRYSMAIPVHNRIPVEDFRYLVDAIKSFG